MGIEESKIVSEVFSFICLVILHLNLMLFVRVLDYARAEGKKVNM
jgi:hypothetical protein